MITAKLTGYGDFYDGTQSRESKGAQADFEEGLNTPYSIRRKAAKVNSSYYNHKKNVSTGIQNDDLDFTDSMNTTKRSQF
jgi:hypothetical protein